MKLLAAAIAFALPFAARIAGACSCVPPKPPKQSLAAADAVFHGTVASIEPLEAANATSTSPDGRLRVTFKVARVWKGDVTERFVMEGTSPNVGMCDFPYAVGSDYIIYAYVRNGTATTGLCTRSAELPDKKPNGDFAKLGPGKPPKPTTP